MTEARILEDSGHTYDAISRYRAIVQDYGDIQDVSEAQMRVDELARSGEVRRAEKQMREIVKDRREQDDRLSSFLDEVRTSSRVPSAEDAVRRFKIDELKRHSSDQENRIAALAAQRLLENFFIHFSYYEPRYFLEEGAPAVAVGLLLIADEIRPRHPRVCYGLAQGYAQAGQPDEALQALDCLVASGAITIARIEADSLLEPLRADPRYRELLDKAR
jgi:hypothetical protein